MRRQAGTLGRIDAPRRAGLDPAGRRFPGHGLGRLCAAVSFAAITGCGSLPAKPLSELTPAEWQQDIDFVVEVLTRRHPDPFGYHGVDPDRFAARVVGVREVAAQGLPMQTVLALDGLVALVGDGHTSLDAVQPRAGLPRLPLGAAYFGDELWIVAAAPESRAALGARIVAIGDRPVAEALTAVSRLISRDNPQEILYFGPTYLMTPEALRFVGVVEGVDTVRLTVERDGSIEEVAVPARAHDLLDSEGWLRIRGPDARPPLYLTRPEDAYWFQHLPEHDAVYLNWDRIDDADNGPSLGDFYEAVFELLDREEVGRMVIDLRQNNGGNFHRADHFMEKVLERPRLGRPGALYVLTAPRTFSAATHVAARLHFEAGALLVGESSRGNPNFAYNAETVILPRSGLRMEYTDRLHRSPPFPQLGDLRRLPVQISVHNSFGDYHAGHDAVLEAALAHEAR